MRTHNAPTWWLFACAPIGLAILSGCSLRRVDSDYGPGIKLCGLGPNFVWRPGFFPAPEDPHAPYYEVKDYTRHVIECSLEKRGFVLTTSGTVDFWIDYGLCSKALPDAYDQDIEHEHGVLVLRMFDPASRLMIWRGWAEFRISESASPQRRRKVICEAVEAILDRFPYIPRYYVNGETGQVRDEAVIEGSGVELESMSPPPMPASPCPPPWD